MIVYTLALGSLGLAILAICLQKTYYFFPAHELKRQARAGDRDAAELYRAVAYGASLRLLLWLIIGITIAGCFVLLSSLAPAWLVFLALTGAVWYAFVWSRGARISSVGARLTLLITPYIAKILYYTHPLLETFARTVERYRPPLFHTGLFERSDLITLIKNQQRQADSRIPPAELDLVLHALTFGDKTVESVMIPRNHVASVKDTDVIGPILMDELYESKHSRFVVLRAKNTDDIVGTLHLRDLIAETHGGTVAGVMKPGINYVHADQTLYQVLHAFLTTKHHLFAVIDSHENYVGIITIEDVLAQVIGKKIEDDFDGYNDKAAVAASVSRKPGIT